MEVGQLVRIDMAWAPVGGWELVGATSSLAASDLETVPEVVLQARRAPHACNRYHSA